MDKELPQHQHNHFSIQQHLHPKQINLLNVLLWQLPLVQNEMEMEMAH